MVRKVIKYFSITLTYLLSFIVTFFKMKWKPILSLLSLNAPHNNTLFGCLTLLAINFGSWLEAVSEQCTIFKNQLANLKLLISLFSLFLFRDVQTWHFLQKTSFFFFIAAKSRGFFATHNLVDPGDGTLF